MKLGYKNVLFSSRFHLRFTVDCNRNTLFQIDQYYSTLPFTDVPKVGSKGEVIRNQRLIKQLPRQDLALSACKFVEAEHRTGYQVSNFDWKMSVLFIL